MEIDPGVGVPPLRLGMSREQIERILGVPDGPQLSSVYYDAVPVIVHFADDATVQLLEVPCGDPATPEITLAGVSLSHRFMHEAVGDLVARGHTWTRSAIGYDFHAGFALFSMSSRSASQLDPSASEDDERQILEGIGVAPYEYFAGPSAG